MGVMITFQQFVSGLREGMHITANDSIKPRKAIRQNITAPPTSATNTSINRDLASELAKISLRLNYLASRLVRT
jgi:hypothetical protein